jgi:ATP-binding cassette subfamily B protein
MPPIKMKSDYKVKNSKKTLKGLWQYLKVYKWQLIISIIFTCISAGLTAYGPILIKELTTSAINKDMPSVNVYGIILLGVYLIATLCNLVQINITVWIGQKISYKLRD